MFFLDVILVKIQVAYGIEDPRQTNRGGTSALCP